MDVVSSLRKKSHLLHQCVVPFWKRINPNWDCDNNTKHISIICSFCRKRIHSKGYNTNYTKITKKI